MSCAPLSGLSDRELLTQISQLVRKERATTLEVLSLLDEIDRRRLYLSLGYGSLFDYCTRRLKYSASSAVRRIQTARAMRRFPAIRDVLEAGEANLSTVSLISDVLTKDNVAELLGRIRNRSQKDVEAIVSGYKAPVSFRDRVRPVCVAVPASSGAADGRAERAPRLGEETQNPCNPLILRNRCGCAAGGTAAGPPGACTEKGALLQPSTDPGVSHFLPGVSSPSTQTEPSPPAMPRLERRLLVQFLASEAFMQKFEQARALLSNRLEEKSFEKVFEATIDTFLERHSPERKNARRERRKTKRQGAGKPAKKAKTPGESRPEPAKAPVATARKTDTGARRIPAAVRDRVFERDNARCTFIARTGERCGATHGLQIDHVVPYARGGKNTVENLRLLCGKHNRLEAERVYGANAIRRYRPRE